MKKTIIVFTTDEKFKDADIGRLRGFVGNIFAQDTIFHNHLSEYNFLYESSKIQYKLINESLAILGLGDLAGELLRNKVMLLDCLNIDDKFIRIKEKKIIEEEFELEITEKLNSYKFTSLWLGLNQENYKKYKNKEITLETALRNNIIEIFKMCGVWADKEIVVEGNFNEFTVKKKETKMLGVSGVFRTNVVLPEYIGIGKRKSLGFGTIKKYEGGENVKI